MPGLLSLAVVTLVVGTACTSGAGIPNGEPPAALLGAKDVERGPAVGGRQAGDLETALPRKAFSPMGVAFWDARRGLLVGRLCRGAGLGDCKGLVLRTIDGGKNWRSIQPWARPLGDVTVWGRRSAWVVTDGPCPEDDGCHAPGVLFTKNAGRTWHRITTALVRDITMVTRQVGFARPKADPEDKWARLPILETADGGETWTESGSPCKNPPQTAGLSFVDAAHGWALCVGEGGAGHQPKRVMETFDGGASWEPLAPTFAPRGLGSGGYGYGLFFLPDGHGWAHGHLEFSATHDGGETWSPLHLRFDAIMDVWFIDEQIGFAVTGYASPSLLKTGDGGRHWRRIGRSSAW